MFEVNALIDIHTWRLERFAEKLRRSSIFPFSPTTHFIERCVSS